jgi:hypothetical protein
MYLLLKTTLFPVYIDLNALIKGLYPSGQGFPILKTLPKRACEAGQNARKRENWKVLDLSGSAIDNRHAFSVRYTQRDMHRVCIPFSTHTTEFARRNRSHQERWRETAL